MESKKNGTDEFIYKTEIDSQMEGKKKTYNYWWGGSGKGYYDIVIDIYTLLYIK